MYRYNLIKDIEAYINCEIIDSIVYDELSKLSDESYSKYILKEIGEDEKIHSEDFKLAYYYLTGIIYIPPKNELVKKAALEIEGINKEYDFKNYLNKRISLETDAYKKYGEQYIYAPCQYIKDLFFSTKNAEASHAMRLPLLLEEC